MCSLGIEPTALALLTQCSTTEPQEYNLYCKESNSQSDADVIVLFDWLVTDRR